MILKNSQPTKSSKKKAWTESEDILLVSLVDKQNPSKWGDIAKNFSDRTGKQCRQRWHNHLDPKIKKQNWSSIQQFTLFLCHKIKGNKWAQMTQYLPGRTDNSIKNHWNSTMQKKLKQMKIRLKRLHDNPQQVDQLSEIEKKLFQIIKQNYEQDSIIDNQSMNQIQNFLIINISKKEQFIQENLILQQTAKRQKTINDDFDQKNQQSTKKKKIKKRISQKQQNKIMLSESPNRSILNLMSGFINVNVPSIKSLFNPFQHQNIDPNICQQQQLKSLPTSIGGFENKSTTIFLSTTHQWEIYFKTPQQKQSHIKNQEKIEK